MRPVSTSRRMPRTGSSVCRSRTSSPWMRSGLTIERVARSSRHRLDGRGVDVEAELRREAGGAQHPQRVVAEADARIGRGAQPSGDEVFDAAGRIDQGARGDAQRHRS